MYYACFNDGNINSLILYKKRYNRDLDCSTGIFKSLTRKQAYEMYGKEYVKRETKLFRKMK